MEKGNLVELMEALQEMKDNPKEHPELEEGQVIAHNGEVITL